jgi:hypothetical protein
MNIQVMDIVKLADVEGLFLVIETYSNKDYIVIENTGALDPRETIHSKRVIKVWKGEFHN